MLKYIGGKITCTETLKIKIDKLSDIEKTLFIPLLDRAIDYKSRKSILHDSKAVELINKIDYDFARLQKSIDKHAIIGHALRARYFDNQVRQYLERFPNGVVVNIGCGLDSRFLRIDNGKVTFFDLDLPEVIEIRRKLLYESLRNPFIGCSVLDPSWLANVNSVAAKQQCPVLFIAEGVFVYISREELQILIDYLAKNFPKAEFIFEVYSNFMVKHLVKNIGKIDVHFKWGVRNCQELETWHPKFKFVKKWSFFEDPDAHHGSLRILGHIPFIANGTLIVHYQFI